jgi:hypothetical protein
MVVDNDAADAAKRREQKRKLPKTEEANGGGSSLARILLEQMGLPPLEDDGAKETGTTGT